MIPLIISKASSQRLRSWLATVTIASSGNAFDFGDMSTHTNNTANLASSTRGIMAGGTVSPTRVNTIQFVTINTQGNTVDFGDLTVTGLASNLMYNGTGSVSYTHLTLPTNREV